MPRETQQFEELFQRLRAIGAQDDLLSKMRSQSGIAELLKSPHFMGEITSDIDGNQSLAYSAFMGAALRRAQMAVARLVPVGAPTWVRRGATGFLVGPSLLLTNWHVMEDERHARAFLVSLGYAEDDGEVASLAACFATEPEKCFFSCQDLDYALVAVSPRSLDGQELRRFGWLRLNGSVRVSPPELVNIIHYPVGDIKYISFRDNPVLPLGNLSPVGNRHPGSRIWYKADTSSGSSGAPVFNDAWQVVAIHSAGAMDRDERGLVRLEDGGLATDDQVRHASLKTRKEVANEGIVIGKVLEHLAQATRLKPNSMVEALLEDIASGEEVFDSGRPSPSRSGRGSSSDHDDLLARRGYQERFLDESIPLPDFARAEAVLGPMARLANGEAELKYENFSIVMSTQHRLALFSAVNVDGQRLVNIPDAGGMPDWLPDPRLSEAAQWAVTALDVARPDFARGHLVRRVDPVWGGQSERARRDCFYVTNCVPKFVTFNPGENWWDSVENHVLHLAGALGRKASVFSGPILLMKTRGPKGVSIPEGFWKIVVCKRPGGELLSAGFVVYQGDSSAPMRSGMHADACVGRQMSLTGIERISRLRFPEILRRVDVAVRDGFVDGERPVYWFDDIRV